MRKFLLAAILLSAVAFRANAQSLDDLNIQIHGYATQGFLYTSQNNILTTDSSDGSPAWSEAVVNVTAQPMPKLRVGVQARYFLLGNLGNSITLDWAAADYKVNDKFGVRFGKVKTPSGLLNEFQDIDPSYMWSLLPQGIYPITSRNSVLAHYGGVAYGTLKLGPRLGKLEYRGWGGERVLGADDGYWISQRESGINLTNGISGATMGAALHWETPLPGLMVGASYAYDNEWSAALTDTIPGLGTFNGTETIEGLTLPQFFGKYEKNKIMVAAEHSRLPATGLISVPGLFATPFQTNQQAWYVMASYKVTTRLSAGVYDTQSVDRSAALGPARYSKDWAISGRYDFNQYLYAKAEEHFIDGTLLNYDAEMNPHGLAPSTKMTVLKLGVMF